MLIDFANREKAARDIMSLAYTIRSRRKLQEENWLLFHSAWAGKYTRSFYRSEVFNHYIPSFRRAIERFAKRGVQMVLPSNDYFEVYPADELSDIDGKRAHSVLMYCQYIMRNKIRIYSLIKQLFRTFCLYGRAVTKTGVKVVVEDGRKRVWPTTRAVDPFQFFVWPETENDIDQASILMEDSIIPWDRYVEHVESKRADPLDHSDLTTPVWPVHITRRILESGIPEPHSIRPGTSTENPNARTADSDFVQLSEVWVNYGTYWKFGWIVWNLGKGPAITRVSDKQFPRPAYRIAIDREIPGEQYTSSMGADLEPVQILVNDAANMYFEGTAMEIAGPVAVDTMQVNRHSSLVFRPRAKWLVPPTAIAPVFPNRGTTVVRAAQGFLQFSIGLVDTFSGSSPLAEGQSIRNMPRAGFAVSSMLSMALSDIRDAAKSIEDDLLTPLVRDIYNLTIEYVPETQVIRIPGTRDFPPKTVVKQELEGNWSFIWVGSMQAQDYQEKAQRLATVLKILTDLAPVIGPDLAARGKRINWTALLKRIWREGLGERGVDSLIEDVPAQELAAAAGAGAGAPENVPGAMGTPQVGGAPGGSVESLPFRARGGMFDRGVGRVDLARAMEELGRSGALVEEFPTGRGVE